MERTDEGKWHLIRNDNGEWISSDNAVFLSKMELCIMRAAAAKVGRELHVQHGPNGTFWCYHIEIEELERLSPKLEYKQRELRIHKSR